MPTELTAQGQSVPIGTWAGSPGQGLFFLFGGMLYDAATGLYLTKSRVYDPKTGRFLSRDILDESGKNGVYKGFPFGKDAIGTNLYAWCGNSPINRVDPNGDHFVTEWTWQKSGHLESYMVHSGHWASEKEHQNVVKSVIKAGVNLLLYLLLLLVGIIDLPTFIDDCYKTITDTYDYVKSKWVDTSHIEQRWKDTSHMVSHEVWIPDSELQLQSAEPTINIKEQDFLSKEYMANAMQGAAEVALDLGGVKSSGQYSDPMDVNYKQACEEGRALGISRHASVIIGVPRFSSLESDPDYYPLPEYCSRHGVDLPVGP